MTTSLVFLIGLAVALFALAFLTRRRFGVLGLSLAAGSVISANWADTLTPLIEQQGLVIVAPPLSIIVQALLILLPSFILLFSGPTYNGAGPRLVGAVAFSLLAMAFLLDPLGASLKLEGGSQAAYDLVKQFQSGIVVAGLLGAIIDLCLTRTPKEKKL